jgi:hypothetical protein
MMSQRYETVYVDDSTRILKRNNMLGRAWIVHDVDSEETLEDILTLLSLRLADPSRSVLLVDEEPELGFAGPGASESVVVTSYKADEIQIQVTAEARGMVVLSEIFDPGWTATIDGESTRVYAANGVLRGVIVEPGVHDIVFRYEAGLAKTSLLFYLVPLLFFVGLGVPSNRNRTHRRGAAVLAN